MAPKSTSAAAAWELVKFPLRNSSDTLVFPAELTPEDFFGLPVTERPNHDSRLLLRHVNATQAGDSGPFDLISSKVRVSLFLLLVYRRRSCVGLHRG